MVTFIIGNLFLYKVYLADCVLFFPHSPPLTPTPYSLLACKGCFCYFPSLIFFSLHCFPLRLPSSPSHFNKSFIFVVFGVHVDSLSGVKWNFRIALICISLRARDVDKCSPTYMPFVDLLLSFLLDLLCRRSNFLKFLSGSTY